MGFFRPEVRLRGNIIQKLSNTLRGVMALVAFALAAPGLAAAAASLNAPVRVPQMEFQTLMLANGLQVLMVEDDHAPVVNVEVWYHAGSRDEPPGRTGFAHLFEHLMFDGTRNLPGDQFSSYIVRSGGTDNAYTTDDATVFWETMPSATLPTALWLEADRMRGLQITPGAFRNEREVVKEERRERFDNQPYGNVVETLYANAFTVHPYHHMTIGSMEDLNRASVEDVKQFYDTYYVPNNATLVLIGDFDTTQASEWVRQDFSPLEGTGKPVERHIPVEPPQRVERVVKLQQPVALPAFVEGYHMPADGTPDAYPLHLAAKILADGDSSWIYQRLVYEKQIAVQAESSGNFTEDPNLFFVFAVMNAGHTPAEGESEVRALIERLKAQPVSEEDLEKAKNQTLRDFILNRQSAESRADELGYDAVVLNDADLVNTELQRFLAVRAADIQRVAQKYFVPANLTLVEVVPRVEQ